VWLLQRVGVGVGRAAWGRACVENIGKMKHCVFTKKCNYVIKQNYRFIHFCKNAIKTAIVSTTFSKYLQFGIENAYRF
jgi:hypothetical protein